MAFLDENGLEHFWGKISDKFSMHLLWENASPASNVAEYVIPMSAEELSLYKYLLIGYKDLVRVLMPVKYNIFENPFATNPNFSSSSVRFTTAICTTPNSSGSSSGEIAERIYMINNALLNDNISFYPSSVNGFAYSLSKNGEMRYWYIKNTELESETGLTAFTNSNAFPLYYLYGLKN